VAKVDALDEFQGVSLGDPRREARVQRVVGALAANPAAAFPTAMRTTAEREALYRLLNNSRVTMEALLAPHISQTVRRIAQRPERPIVAIDKTFFVFGGEADREGLERVGGNRQGFDAFVGLAMSTDRVPHGVLAVQPLEQHGRSAAASWETFVDLAAAPVASAKIQPIFVMDREADAYGLLSALVAKRHDFVVRASAARMVHDGDLVEERISELAARAPTTMTKTVRLSRRGKGGRSTRERQKYPPRATRDAVLSVRACPVVLPKRRHVRDAIADQIELYLVQVLEENPPQDVEPVEWLLVSSLPIADATCVEAIVDAYRARWTIEEYFKALKTGCSFEKRQLESKDALVNALGLLVPIAWTLLALRTLGDEYPTTAASSVLQDDELVVLRKLSGDIKLGPSPTVAEVVLALAHLGGHFAQNGRPGWLVIWRGMQKLIDRVEGYRLARAEM
jgi:hypothetical protein